MHFINYLKERRKFLLIWFVIHAFAWFVNAYDIRGDIYSDWGYDGSTGINLWTDGSNDKEEHFWPFVGFVDRETSYIQGYGDTTRERHNFDFRGLFYEYDFSEFIAYSVLIFVWFYFRFLSSGSKSEQRVVKTENPTLD